MLSEYGDFDIKFLWVTQKFKIKYYANYYLSKLNILQEKVIQGKKGQAL
jgi:hypothetical protein